MASDREKLVVGVTFIIIVAVIVAVIVGYCFRSRRTQKDKQPKQMQAVPKMEGHDNENLKDDNIERHHHHSKYIEVKLANTQDDNESHYAHNTSVSSKHRKKHKSSKVRRSGQRSSRDSSVERQDRNENST